MDDNYKATATANYELPVRPFPSRRGFNKYRTRWWRVIFVVTTGALLLSLHASWHMSHPQWRRIDIADATLSAMRVLRPRRDDIQQSCTGVVLPASQACPKYLTIRYLSSAGIGHQFSELFFALYAAQYLGLSFTWAPIVSSTDHGDDYSSLFRLLGLEQLFVDALGARRASSLPPERKAANSPAGTNSPTWVYAGWDKDKRTLQMPCNSVLVLDAWHHCHGVPHNNCFWAPEHEFLFQRYASCFRAGVREFGTAFDTCLLLKPSEIERDATLPSASLPSNTVVVVWHVRLGDVAPHKIGDQFYARVIETLGTITRGRYNLQILLIGGGSGRVVTQGYVEMLRNMTAAQGLNGTSVRRSWADDFESQFVAMMQADVLIGSGSSVPQVAALLSGRPLFLNHEPKHGYGHGMEATWDTVDMKSDGTVLDSVRRVRLALFAKMEQRGGDAYNPCRPSLHRVYV